MLHQDPSLQRAQTFLIQLLTQSNFVEVSEKKNLLDGRYYICPIGEDSKKITVMFSSREEATKALPPIAKAKVPFERPEDKLYTIKVLIRALAEASLGSAIPPTVPATTPASENQSPIIEVAKFSAQPEQIAAKENVVAEANLGLIEILQNARKDPDFGYTNTCTRTATDGIKYRVFYFKTTEQAVILNGMLSKVADGVFVGGKGVNVPIDAYPVANEKPKEKSISKSSPAKTVQAKKEEPEVTKAPEAAKTSDDFFAEFKKAFRSEIEIELLSEFEKLSEELQVTKKALHDITSNNYVICKNGTFTIDFPYDEMGKGITMGTGSFIVKKELLARHNRS